jgi:L-lactate dehydrogenase complex protein LldF
MGNANQSFISASEQTSKDVELQRKLKFNITKYAQTVEKGVKQFSDMETASQRAKNIKWKTIESLEKYLLDFEANFSRRGGKVIWAETADEALREIETIVLKANATSVVKSKSMTTEEVHLNQFLEKLGIEVVETDLGEYIQQLDGEPPFHIVTPAMHKSKEDVARVFHEKLGTPLNLTPQEMTMVARKNLREKYLRAQVGITGGNFLLADPGAIVVTENEGNARLSITFPKIHIAIVGIEKILPSINDLQLFLPLLATHGTGQNITVYNSIITGPRQENEPDGPEEMYVILLDNGRTNLLAETDQREALYCIRCGACLNACPIYKSIGGFSYQTTYTGPIGSVITPHFKGMEQFKHLSNASSLCGNCTEVCPMRINLHNLLVINRKDAVKDGHYKRTEKMGWQVWKMAMMNRSLMNKGGSGIKNFMLSNLFKNSWGRSRSLPVVAKKSFHQLWKEKYSGYE